MNVISSTLPASKSASPASRMTLSTGKIIGESPLLQEVRDEIARVAKSDAKVLISGESGVGKELVADALHAESNRANGPFVAVNCAGLPETLLESELFGYVKGSFTGAFRDKPGKLEVAHGGTVFLDEIGEMTLRMQGLLLRFLETGELQKVGAFGDSRSVNVRVVTATNRRLRDLVMQGIFREDLFYRINVIQIVVPPLRDRSDRHPAAGRSLRAAGVHSQLQWLRPLAAGVFAGGDDGDDGVSLAGQRPRIAQRRRAAGRQWPIRTRHARRTTDRDPIAAGDADKARRASAAARWATSCSSAS